VHSARTFACELCRSHEAAQAVVRMIVETHFAPNKMFPEVRKLEQSRNMLRAFSGECRTELRSLKAA
jgi:hypothetical protein